MKETIYINKDIETVWDFVELEFAKVFKCSPKKLKGKQITVKRKGKDLTQTIIIHNKPHHLALLSEDDYDHVETHYQMLADEDGCFLTLHEFGKGKNNLLKTLFYKSQKLPIIHSRRKKQQRQRLESLKYLIEQEEI